MSNTLNLADQRIGFLNFEGRDPNGFNKEHARSFAIFLDDQNLIDDLVADGFNVKYPKPLPDVDPAEDRRTPYLQVTVSNGPEVNYGVKVYLIEEEGARPTRIQNDNLDIIDTLNIESADIVINPYHWEVRGEKGTKAFLKAVYLKLNTSDVDEFAAKYGL